MQKCRCECSGTSVRMLFRNISFEIFLFSLFDAKNQPIEEINFYQRVQTVE